MKNWLKHQLTGPTSTPNIPLPYLGNIQISADTQGSRDVRSFYRAFSVNNEQVTYFHS